MLNVMIDMKVIYLVDSMLGFVADSVSLINSILVSATAFVFYSRSSFVSY